MLGSPFILASDPNDPLFDQMIRTFNNWFEKDSKENMMNWHIFFNSDYVSKNIYKQLDTNTDKITGLSQRFSEISLQGYSNPFGNLSPASGGSKNVKQKNVKKTYTKDGMRIVNIDGVKYRKMIWKLNNRCYIRNRNGEYQFIYKSSIS